MDADLIERAIGLAERHPTGFLVIALVIALVWLVRRYTRLQRERDLIMREMWRAKATGYKVQDRNADDTLIRIDPRAMEKRIIGPDRRKS